MVQNPMQTIMEFSIIVIITLLVSFGRLKLLFKDSIMNLFGLDFEVWLVLGARMVFHKNEKDYFYTGLGPMFDHEQRN